MSVDSTFKEKFLNHLNKNRGKYATVVGVGGTLGTINLAGNGYLGTAAQDTVHDLAYPIAQNLKINSIQKGTEATIDPYIDVYKKTDNILNNEENAKLLDTEKILQKENIPAIGSSFGEKLVSNISGLTPNEKWNYVIRNPKSGMELKIDEMKAPAKGIIDSLSEQ